MDGPAHLRATRASYDAVAQPYAERGADVLDDKPLDRALLAAFAELVLGTGRPEVLDLGCGPGYLTAHLCDLGLAARGLDLSPAMVEEAHRHLTEWFDREVDLDAVLMSPDEVVAELGAAGFSPVARTVREPDGEVERLPRAFLLVRRPPAAQ